MKTNLFNSVLRGRTIAFTALVVAAMATSAYADPVIINGGFSQQSGSTSNELTNGGGSNHYNGATLTGWSNSSSGAYNFIMTSPDVYSASHPFAGASDVYGSPLTFWAATSSPNGGNFVALDSDFGQGAISQTVTGLTIGDQETITFEFAGAQQHGYDGASTDQLAVSLGGQTLYSTVLSDPSHGFTGWTTESLTFTATSTSEVLSFFAIGTPNNVPSFALLDGVSIAQTPEPGSLALLSTGLIGIGGLVRRRFSK